MVWTRRATSSCCIGWTRRGATSCCRRRAVIRRSAAFALRSPVRPNPIALSVARLLRIQGNVLSIVGIDCLDGTPLVDLKPYNPSTDSVPDATVGWQADSKP